MSSFYSRFMVLQPILLPLFLSPITTIHGVGLHIILVEEGLVETVIVGVDDEEADDLPISSYVALVGIMPPLAQTFTHMHPTPFPFLKT